MTSKERYGACGVTLDHPYQKSLYQAMSGRGFGLAGDNMRRYVAFQSYSPKSGATVELELDMLSFWLLQERNPGHQGTSELEST